MDAGARELVRSRAGNRCEYCLLKQEHLPFASFQVEHIIPRKHGGSGRGGSVRALGRIAPAEPSPFGQGGVWESGQVIFPFRYLHVKGSLPCCVGGWPIAPTAL